MSHYYSLYCMDCNAGDGEGINHGDLILQRMWKYRDILAALMNNDADISIDSMWGDSHPNFIAHHARHRVQIRSEYYVEHDRDRELRYRPIELTLAGDWLLREDLGDR